MVAAYGSEALQAIEVALLAVEAACWQRLDYSTQAALEKQLEEAPAGDEPPYPMMLPWHSEIPSSWNWVFTPEGLKAFLTYLDTNPHRQAHSSDYLSLL